MSKLFILIFLLILLIPVDGKVISVSVQFDFDIDVGNEGFSPNFAMYSDDLIVSGGDYTTSTYFYDHNGTLVDKLLDVAPYINTPIDAETVSEMGLYVTRDFGGMIVIWEVNNTINLSDKYTNLRNYAIDVQGQFTFDVTENGILAYAAGNGNIYVYDLVTESFLMNYTAVGYDYQSIAISDDGEQLSYTRPYYPSTQEYIDKPKNITIVEVSSGEHLFTGNVTSFTKLEYLRTDELMLISEDAGISIMNTTDFASRVISTETGFLTAELHPKYDLVFLGGIGCTTSVYNNRDGSILELLDRGSCSGYMVDFSLDGSKLLITSYSNTDYTNLVEVYDLAIELDKIEATPSSSSTDLGEKTDSNTLAFGIIPMLIIPLISEIKRFKKNNQR